MNEATLRDELERAECYVAEAEEHLFRQTDVIADLRQRGDGVARAVELLRALEHAWVARVNIRNQLHAELAKWWGGG